MRKESGSVMPAVGRGDLVRIVIVVVLVGVEMVISRKELQHPGAVQ